LARAYEAAEHPDAAIKQYDLWIQFHAVDARYPAALNGRCWVRALKGTELPLALKDCKAARGRVQKASPLFAKVLDSTGLVLLRMGDYDGSVAEYTASLEINPKNAWSWYGRGIDEQHRHRSAESQADITRAEALWPQVAEAFQRHGITP
jgi:tetratricopeptide (TPR) repeat protein